MVTPPTLTTPLSGTSSALSDRSRVVFPDPDGPTTVVADPDGTVKDNPRRT